ncbi:MAG: 2-C-methyl-D-erythritol 4-phosphate cytidylyltransferase [Bacteroidales bacterium]|jgi:2-C-methyl-D-erythritol 4-phosphate cytidylyltransferase|nr:2-C-methyl-D-erythritol 4-phosphate cytidylyltransferase [Bacteroidales bacterium]NLM92593.1 2-C-methyl-D-erythritol 4-phosphate cytidylyltransferase [Bacteroidales bacterium]
MQRYVLITAGGSGTRMQSGLPKQFIEIAGLPVLMHTFKAFMEAEADFHYVLVLPESHRDYWKGLCEKHVFRQPHQLALSGPTRFHSVKSGLRLVPDDALVAIHDGVRPLVSALVIEQVFHSAERFGNGIPVVAVSDSLRIVDHALSQALPREQVRRVQTPQCFRAELIKKAYNRNYSEVFTDEATLLEADGHRIFLVEGNPENIKITRPADLKMAEAMLWKS